MSEKQTTWDKAVEVKRLLAKLGMIVEIKGISKDILCFERLSKVEISLKKIEEEFEGRTSF